MGKQLLRAVWLLIVSLTIFSAITITYAWLLAFLMNDIPTGWGRDVQGPWGNNVRLRGVLSYALRAAIVAAVLAILSLVVSQTWRTFWGVFLVAGYAILLIASHGWLTFYQW